MNRAERINSIYNSLPKETIANPGRLRHPRSVFALAKRAQSVRRTGRRLRSTSPRLPDGSARRHHASLRTRPGMQVVDVGCGTGISTRLLAARGLNVIGIEPNGDMRRQAEAIGCPTGPAATFREGRAEATGLPAETASLVLVAQAFHWFATESTLREFHRILKHERLGLSLMWNEQDRSDPFTEAYFQALVRHSAEPQFAARTYHSSADVLLNSTLFESHPRIVFAHQQQLDEDQLIGRAFSASFAPREEESASTARIGFATRLREIPARWFCHHAI